MKDIGALRAHPPAFQQARGEFNAVLSPAGPYEVPDEVGDGMPNKSPGFIDYGQLP